MEEKQFTRAEIAARNHSADAVFVIDNVVYEVTRFLDEHPGGHEVLVAQAGADASEHFHDVGHSLDAKELMRRYRVGELVEADRVPVQSRTVVFEDSRRLADEDSGWASSWRVPLLLALLATLLYSYLL